MGDWKRITMADLEALPVGYRTQIKEDFLDAYAHMNVMWYTHLFSCALEDIFQRVGLTNAYFEANQAGTFALEGHVRYFNEVRVGQQVTIRTRLIGRSAPPGSRRDRRRWRRPRPPRRRGGRGHAAR